MKYLTEQELDELPIRPLKPEDYAVAEYVHLLFQRTPKREALKKCFPERYKRAEDGAKGDKRIFSQLVNLEISRVERRKYAKDLFEAANKDWWVAFIDKKDRLLNKLYDIGMDDERETKDQISSIKTFLQYAPQAPKEDTTIKVDVNHKIEQEEAFTNKLESMKKRLHEAANAEAIDAEIEDNLDDS